MDPMFSISFSELSVLILVALLFLKPKDIRSIGNKFKEIKSEFGGRDPNVWHEDDAKVIYDVEDLDFEPKDPKNEK